MFVSNDKSKHKLFENYRLEGFTMDRDAVQMALYGNKRGPKPYVPPAPLTLTGNRGLVPVVTPLEPVKNRGLTPDLGS